MKVPSLKNVPAELEKENKPASKYLSSELKIKLKSQAELQAPPPVPSTLSGGRSRASKEGLVTLGRL